MVGVLIGDWKSYFFDEHVHPKSHCPMPKSDSQTRFWSIIALLLVAIAVTVVVVIVFWPRPPRPTSCIQVPELTDSTKRTAALDLAVKLEGIPLDANLKPKFAELSETTFQTLTEKQAAFLLLLRAIDCLVNSADTIEKQALVKQLAPELITTARAMWATSHDLKGSGDSLSPKERDLLESSSYGTEILSKLNKAGIK